MKHMRYIKLFEAFESTKLAKTLGYISNSGEKNKFMDVLNSIAKTIDFPISNFSDDLFEYLPFKRALDFAPGIEKGQLKYIKFWFDLNGNFICVTGVDGELKQSLKEIPRDAEQIRSLPTGTPVRLKKPERAFQDDPDSADGKIFKQGRRVYFISNSRAFSGSEPGDLDWRPLGRYSWCIVNEFGGIDMAKLEQVTTGSLNSSLLISDRITLSPISTAEQDLKKAHFALVLDYQKLKSMQYAPVSKTKQERELSKKDAVALMSPEEIKKQNIQRYLDEILRRAKIPTDIKDFGPTILKFLGGQYIGYFILCGDGFDFSLLDNFKSFIDFITELMFEIQDESISQSFIDEKIEVANKILRDKISRNKGYAEIIRQSITETKEKFGTQDFVSPEIKILDLLMETNSIIYDKIKEFKFETIEDLELVYRKLANIRDVSRSSSNYSILYANTLFRGFGTQGLFVRNMQSYFNNSDKREILQRFPRFINLIKRL